MLAKKIVAFMFPFIVACAIGYYLEHGLEDLLRPDNTGPFLSFADYSGLYQLIMAKEAKSRHLHGTVIVEIDPLYDQRELSLHTLCEQRLFLSELLNKLAKAKSDVIVIDKWLSPSFCLQDNKGTQSLVETVNKVCKDTPIVIGLLEKNDKTLQPSLKFDCGHKLMEGLLTIEKDSKRLPLQYSVLVDGQYQVFETLAVKAVKARDSNFLGRKQHSQLVNLIAQDVHPFVNFLDSCQFPKYHAGELVYGRRPGDQDQKDATANSYCEYEKPDNLTYLENAIVVIGETHPALDQHFSVIGKVPGFILQANYIEALLDNRYYKPIPWLDLLFGFLIFFVLEAIFHLFKHNFIWLFLFVGGVLILAYLMIFEVVLHFGWYIDPTISISAIAFRVLFTISDKIHEVSWIPPATKGLSINLRQSRINKG